MKKIIKNIVKILLLIIVIVSISVGGGLLYLKANLLDFDKNFDTNQYEIIE
jgi:cell division protein FtsL